MSSSGDIKDREGKGIPSLNEIVILAQAIANGILVYWVLKEYLNNQYLQTYLGGLIAANTFTLELVSVGTAVAAVGILVRFKSSIWNLIRNRAPPLLAETEPPIPPIITPMRARAMSRARSKPDSSSKASPASDALANAAARVLKQMEVGQGSTASVTPASSVHDGPDKGEGFEHRLTERRDAPIAGRLEAAGFSQTKQWTRTSSQGQLEGQRPLQGIWPSFSKQVSTMGVGTQGLGEREAGLQHNPPLRPVDSRRDPIGLSPSIPSQFSKPPEPEMRDMHKPSTQFPKPVRHVESGQGPLDNPLPTNPLLPVLRQVPPTSPTVQESQIGLKAPVPLGKPEEGSSSQVPTEVRPRLVDNLLVDKDGPSKKGEDASRKGGDGRSE